MPHGRSELIAIVKNGKLSWLERGEAVDELCQAEPEETVARLTGLSKETINKQRIWGSEREFVRSGILRGFGDFLKNDVFGVGDGHALCFQE